MVTAEEVGLPLAEESGTPVCLLGTVDSLLGERPPQQQAQLNTLQGEGNDTE